MFQWIVLLRQICIKCKIRQTRWIYAKTSPLYHSSPVGIVAEYRDPGSWTEKWMHQIKYEILSYIWHSRTYMSLSNYSRSTFVEQWIFSEHLTFTECYVFSKSIKIYQKFYWYLVLLDIHWMSTEDIGTFRTAQQLHFQNCWKNLKLKFGRYVIVNQYVKTICDYPHFSLISDCSGRSVCANLKQFRQHTTM